MKNFVICRTGRWPEKTDDPCLSRAYVEMVQVLGVWSWKIPPGWAFDRESNTATCPSCKKGDDGPGGEFLSKPRVEEKAVPLIIEAEPLPPRRPNYNPTGDICSNCQGSNLVPAGGCLRCMDCGTGTGCG